MTALRGDQYVDAVGGRYRQGNPPAVGNGILPDEIVAIDRGERLRLAQFPTRVHDGRRSVDKALELNKSCVARNGHTAVAGYAIQPLIDVCGRCADKLLRGAAERFVIECQSRRRRCRKKDRLQDKQLSEVRCMTRPPLIEARLSQCWVQGNCKRGGLLTDGKR